MRYLVSCVLNMDLPRSTLQELWPAEAAQSLALLTTGTMEHMFVVDSSSRTFLVFSVSDREALKRELSKYPLFEYASWDIFPLR